MKLNHNLIRNSQHCNKRVLRSLHKDKIKYCHWKMKTKNLKKSLNIWRKSTSWLDYRFSWHKLLSKMHLHIRSLTYQWWVRYRKVPVLCLLINLIVKYSITVRTKNYSSVLLILTYYPMTCQQINNLNICLVYSLIQGSIKMRKGANYRWSDYRQSRRRKQHIKHLSGRKMLNLMSLTMNMSNNRVFKNRSSITRIVWSSSKAI